jgi:hypothetical protein
MMAIQEFFWAIQEKKRCRCNKRKSKQFFLLIVLNSFKASLLSKNVAKEKKG